ncbi:hypothetical protein ANAEL_02059 [Anaerolineales bacterium]|nr:hypothetical protein ANAEL_02059 [Anaerolineales bacterium]
MSNNADTQDDAIPIGEETAEELAFTTNIYIEIRKRLALRGVPAEEVAFIHDAKTPEARAKLFAAVNKGEIRILIGSTEKMGTGMNVQERCIAMHTITPPWRPGDIEQQVGRVLRQGNLFPQVFQFVHVTEGSFDAYVWQLLENKAGFIAQIARGQVTNREVDDVDNTVLTFSEIKALASGNPLIMQKIVMDAELARLSAIRASWQSSQSSVRGSIRGIELKKEAAENSIAVYLDAIRQCNENTRERFLIQLKPSIDADLLEAETDREAAGRKVRLLAAHAAMRLAGRGHNETFTEIGSYRGFAINVTVSTLDDSNQPIPQLFFRVGSEILLVSAETEVGVSRSMDIRLNSLENMLEDARERVRVAEAKIQAALTEMNRPWDHKQKYLELEEKVKSLDASLKKDGQAPLVPTPASARELIAQKSDTAGEMQKALSAMRAMLADPGIVVRFSGQNDILSVEGLEDLGREIEVKQALFDFGAALVQFDLFGGFVVAPTKKNRRR